MTSRTRKLTAGVVVAVLIGIAVLAAFRTSRQPLLLTFVRYDSSNNVVIRIVNRSGLSLAYGGIGDTGLGGFTGGGKIPPHGVQEMTSSRIPVRNLLPAPGLSVYCWRDDKESPIRRLLGRIRIHKPKSWEISLGLPPSPAQPMTPRRKIGITPRMLDFALINRTGSRIN